MEFSVLLRISKIVFSRCEVTFCLITIFQRQMDKDFILTKRKDEQISIFGYYLVDDLYKRLKTQKHELKGYRSVGENENRKLTFENMLIKIYFVEAVYRKS